LLGLLVFAALANFLVASSGPGGYNRYFRSLAGLRVAEERVKASHRYLNRYARDGRVLMVGDAEVVDLEMPVYYSTCFDDCLLEQLVKGHTPDEIRAGLASRGITHVVVDWGEIARYRSPGNYGFTDFVQPAVLEGLVKQGILEPISELGIDPGTRMWFGFRVVGP